MAETTMRMMTPPLRVRGALLPVLVLLACTTLQCLLKGVSAASAEPSFVEFTVQDVGGKGVSYSIEESTTMSQPQLKLTYFNGAGRAELTRLLFAAGGVAFEDERLERSEMRALKPTLPLGQLPVLSIDGVVFPQSMAIARYAAAKVGLLPRDPLDLLKADVVSETLNEVFSAVIEIVHKTTDEKEKAAKTKVMIDETMPKLLGFIEKQIQGKFVLGDAMSYADLQLFTVVQDVLVVKFPDFKLEAYAKIQSVMENVKANANVAAYLAKRP